MYNEDSSIQSYWISPRAAQFALGVHVMHQYNAYAGYKIIRDITIDEELRDTMRPNEHLVTVGLEECRQICTYYNKCLKDYDWLAKPIPKEHLNSITNAKHIIKAELQIDTEEFIDWLVANDVSKALPLFIKTDICKEKLEAVTVRELKSDKFRNTNSVKEVMADVIDDFINELFSYGKSSMDAYTYDRNPAAYILNTYTEFYIKDITKVTKILNQTFTTDELADGISKQDLMNSVDLDCDISKCLIGINTLYSKFFDKTANPYSIYIHTKHSEEIMKFREMYFPFIKRHKEFESETRRNKYSYRLGLFKYFVNLCDSNFTYLDLLNAYKGAIPANEAANDSKSGFGLFDGSKGTHNGLTNDMLLQYLYDGLHSIRSLYNFCKANNNIFLSADVFEVPEWVNAIKTKHTLFYDFDLIQRNVTASPDPTNTLHSTAAVTSTLMQNNDLISIIQAIQHIKVSEVRSMPVSNKVLVHHTQQSVLGIFNDVNGANQEVTRAKIELEIEEMHKNLSEASFNSDYAVLILRMSKLYYDCGVPEILDNVALFDPSLEALFEVSPEESQDRPDYKEYLHDIMDAIATNEKVSKQTVLYNTLSYLRYSYVIFKQYQSLCAECRIQSEGKFGKVYLNSLLEVAGNNYSTKALSGSYVFKSVNIFRCLLGDVLEPMAYLPEDLITLSDHLMMSVGGSQELDPAIQEYFDHKVLMFVQGYAFDGFKFIKIKGMYVHRTGRLVSYSRELKSAYMDMTPADVIGL